MKKSAFLIIAAIFIVASCTNQKQEPVKDKGKIINYDKAEMFMYNQIMKSLDSLDLKPGEETSKKFVVDIEGKSYPTDISSYTTVWRNNPISQGKSGMCWSFATNSFFESEVYRLQKKEVKLSELYTVYWETFEKAMGYIESNGELKFGQGSQANAVTRMYKKYGIVPLELYTGLKVGQEFHDHRALQEELKSYLKELKSKNELNKEKAEPNVIAILNKYLGTPPTEFEVEGKSYTPTQYLSDFLQLNMDDYVNIYSMLEEPFFEKVIYNVPDNWWKSKDYHNVPLELFYSAFKNAVKNGYSISIGGDVSSAGKIAQKGEPQVFIIPSFDIPSEYINDDARQLRFSNESSTDDHLMHAVGYTETEDGTWFLIKDSSSGSRNNSADAEGFGYYFFHEDYVKLKVLTYTVHKDAVADLLSKFK